MKRYKFCASHSDEAISYCNADSYENALEIFSQMKKLPPEDFLKVYRVLEVE